MSTEQEPPKIWRVMRLDENGHEATVSEGHSFGEANEIARRYEAKGHKQTYWVQREPD
jgi:hypothetical protein